MISFTILTPLLLFINSCALAVSTCWYPDGITSEPNHVPCNQTINYASACCAPQDACSGGLCVSVYGAYRGSCTDQSWNSPNCAAREWPPCLTDPSTRRRYNRATPILSCASPGTIGEGVCCGYSNGSSCCSDQFRIGNSGPTFIPGFDAVATGLSAIGGTNTTNITTVPSDNSQNIGTMVGLGVGIPLGLLVAGLIGFLFYREYNKNKLILEPLSSKMALAGAGTVMSQSPKEQHNLYQHYSNSQNGPPHMDCHEPQYSSRNSKPEPVFEVPVSNVHEMRG
ncbi:hypothetical protein OnM2_084033 [Erysiphe neolycopersici]|uniref:Mid2 domain-containing protein n=1 Tax=Erysiphe neolycopersici TaxID=212602 RepID=A0A420HFB9_9PEZI|nr:hypothetical protein OnM2_084033 [Erysiphe neolycopersici]